MACTRQQRRSSFMKLLNIEEEGALVLVLSLVQESSEFFLWVRNHKDKIRLGLYTQVVEKLLCRVISTTCVDRSSPGF